MQAKRVLVCGGAGYIGSHMVRALVNAGHLPVVFDNLSTGHLEAIEDVEFVRGDLLDIQAIRRILGEYCFDAVMHFSAKSLVGESVVNPAIYYTNNVTGTLNLLVAMKESCVNKLVFSSTAAVYGNPKTDIIAEDHPCTPVNPYGLSKLMVEQMLADFARAYDFRSVSLRYFNAAGADEKGDIGEAHNPETHLLPNVLLSALGKTEGLKVFGDDYPTPDGTCVRDYIHVTDLCSAHLAALDYMTLNSGANSFNLGNGNGFSVREVLDAAMRVTGKDIAYKVEARRAGDPAMLVADATHARKELNWQPQYTEMEGIIETAWRWHQNQRY